MLTQSDPLSCVWIGIRGIWWIGKLRGTREAMLPWAGVGGGVETKKARKKESSLESFEVTVSRSSWRSGTSLPLGCFSSNNSFFFLTSANLEEVFCFLQLNHGQLRLRPRVFYSNALTLNYILGYCCQPRVDPELPGPLGHSRCSTDMSSGANSTSGIILIPLPVPFRILGWRPSQHALQLSSCWATTANLGRK